MGFKGKKQMPEWKCCGWEPRGYDRTGSLLMRRVAANARDTDGDSGMSSNWKVVRSGFSLMFVRWTGLAGLGSALASGEQKVGEWETRIGRMNERSRDKKAPESSGQL